MNIRKNNYTYVGKAQHKINKERRKRVLRILGVIFIIILACGLTVIYGNYLKEKIDQADMLPEYVPSDLDSLTLPETIVTAPSVRSMLIDSGSNESSSVEFETSLNSAINGSYEAVSLIIKNESELLISSKTNTLLFGERSLKESLNKGFDLNSAIQKLKNSNLYVTLVYNTSFNKAFNQSNIAQANGQQTAVYPSDLQSSLISAYDLSIFEEIKNQDFDELLITGLELNRGNIDKVAQYLKSVKKIYNNKEIFIGVAIDHSVFSLAEISSIVLKLTENVDFLAMDTKSSYSFVSNSENIATATPTATGTANAAAADVTSTSSADLENLYYRFDDLVHSVSIYFSRYNMRALIYPSNAEQRTRLVDILNQHAVYNWQINK